jgi:hypothetical protein
MFRASLYNASRTTCIRRRSVWSRELPAAAAIHSPRRWITTKRIATISDATFADATLSTTGADVGSLFDRWEIDAEDFLQRQQLLEVSTEELLSDAANMEVEQLATMSSSRGVIGDDVAGEDLVPISPLQEATDVEPVSEFAEVPTAATVDDADAIADDEVDDDDDAAGGRAGLLDVSSTSRVIERVEQPNSPRSDREESAAPLGSAGTDETELELVGDLLSTSHTHRKK